MKVSFLILNQSPFEEYHKIFNVENVLTTWASKETKSLLSNLTYHRFPRECVFKSYNSKEEINPQMHQLKYVDPLEIKLLKPCFNGMSKWERLTILFILNLPKDIKIVIKTIGE